MYFAPTHSMALGPIIFILVLLFLITGTILSWIAAARIRSSDGKLYGLRLAAISGMVLPTLLLIIIPLSAFAIIVRLSSSLQVGDPILFGIATFATLSIASVRTFQGCLRSILGKNSFIQPFGLRKNRIALGILAFLWIGLGFILHLQRPTQLDEFIVAESPNRAFIAKASTWHRMRMFGPDKVTYRFAIQGPGGSDQHAWEIPIPTRDLAKNYHAVDPANYWFHNKGRIHWSDDSSQVVFHFDESEVFTIATNPIRIPSGATVAGTGEIRLVKP